MQSAAPTAAISVGNRATRGAMWSVGASVASRVVGLVGTLYMTRLLAPEVIGEVSAAAVLAASASWMSHWGFNQYMVTRAQGDSERTYHVTVLNVAFATVALVLIALTGSLFAPFLGAPHLAAYLPGLALSGLIRRVSGAADKVLVRELRFRELALATATGEIVFTATAVGLASTTRLGGQAIVVANVVQGLVVSVLVLRATGLAWFQWAPWSWARVKEIFGFGLPLGAELLLSGASRYWDNLAFSALFGGRVLGLYNMAYNLADVPAVQFGEQIAGVLLPAMQKVEEHERKRAIVRAIAVLSVVVFPMAIGLGVVAQSLVGAVLGPQWQGVAPLLTVLCVLSVFRPLTWPIAAYLFTYGRTRVMMVLEALKLALLIGSIAALARFGPVWSAGAVGLAFAVHAVAMVALVVRKDGVPGSAIAIAFARPLLACLVMAAAVLAVRHGMHARGIHRHLAVLVVEVAVGGLVYVSMALLVARETSLELVSRVRGAIRRD